MAEKKKLSSLSLTDLVALERIAHRVCSKYENEAKNYLGFGDNAEATELFNKYNSVYQSLLEEAENRLNNIVIE